MPGIAGGSGRKNGKPRPGTRNSPPSLNALTGSKRRYEAIEQEYKNALAALQHTSRERQQKKFLETRFIDTCTSPRSARTGRPRSGHLA